MLKELIKLANHLDSKGLTKEADFLDSIIKRGNFLEYTKNRMNGMKAPEFSKTKKDVAHYQTKDFYFNLPVFRKNYRDTVTESRIKAIELFVDEEAMGKSNKTKDWLKNRCGVVEVTDYDSESNAIGVRVRCNQKDIVTAQGMK